MAGVRLDSYLKSKLYFLNMQKQEQPEKSYIFKLLLLQTQPFNQAIQLFANNPLSFHDGFLPFFQEACPG